MIRSTQNRLAAFAAASLLAGAATVAVASPALAHDELVGTNLVESEDGQVEAFTLSFSNSIIEVGTEVVVTAPDGSDAKDGAPAVSGPDVTQKLRADLDPGEYSVAWRVVSSDGHPIDGAFAIDVREGGDSAIVEKDPRAAEHEHSEGDEAEGSHDEAESGSGVPTGAIIAIVASAAVAGVGGAVAAVVGAKRRKAAMDEAVNRQNGTPSE